MWQKKKKKKGIMTHLARRMWHMTYHSYFICISMKNDLLGVKCYLFWLSEGFPNLPAWFIWCQHIGGLWNAYLYDISRLFRVKWVERNTLSFNHALTLGTFHGCGAWVASNKLKTTKKESVTNDWTRVIF